MSLRLSLMIGEGRQEQLQQRWDWSPARNAVRAAAVTIVL